MNWAEERASEIEGIFNCTSSREPLVLAIAAELQKVADECAELANERIVDYMGTLAEYACAKVRNDIRARFPEEER